MTIKERMEQKMMLSRRAVGPESRQLVQEAEQLGRVIALVKSCSEMRGWGDETDVIRSVEQSLDAMDKAGDLEVEGLQTVQINTLIGFEKQRTSAVSLSWDTTLDKGVDADEIKKILEGD